MHAEEVDGQSPAADRAGAAPVRVGDFSVRLPGDRTGLTGKIADTFADLQRQVVLPGQRLQRPATALA